MSAPAGPNPGDGFTPAALRTRVSEALRAAGGDEAVRHPTPEACLAAGEALLARVLGGDERSRATALELLAADALVTQAFELAAGRGDAVAHLAEAAMRRIAAHARAAGGDETAAGRDGAGGARDASA